MSGLKKIINQEGVDYEPKIFCFQVMPGLEPNLYDPVLETGLDAIIIITVPTGGVPTEGDYSFIPFIREATELKIPVYLLRGSLSAARRPKDLPYIRNLTVPYGPEIEAIRAGAKPVEIDAVKAGGTPLERPDASQLHEVVEVIRQVYAKRPGYHEGINAVSEEFSRPEFMEQISAIRER